MLQKIIASHQLPSEELNTYINKYWTAHNPTDEYIEVPIVPDGYTDIVYWENVEAAKKAEKDMVNMLNVHEWYGCFKEGSILAKHLNKIM